MIIERDTVGRIHKAANGKYYFQSKFEDGGLGDRPNGR